MKKSATNQKQKTKATAFLPSDYIMSSLDIADAAEMDHEEVLRDLMELGPGPIGRGGFIALVEEDDSTSTERQCLLNLQAVLIYVELLDRAFESYKIGKIILSRFFELAANPSTIPMSLYVEMAENLEEDLETMERFIDHLYACEAERSKAAWSSSQSQY